MEEPPQIPDEVTGVRGMSNMIKITEQVHGRIKNQSLIKPLLLTIIVIVLIFYSRRFQTF